MIDNARLFYIYQIIGFHYLNSFLLGNFSDSLRDAKIATDLQPSFVKTVVRGKLNFNNMVTSFKTPKILLPRSRSNWKFAKADSRDIEMLFDIVDFWLLWNARKANLMYIKRKRQTRYAFLLSGACACVQLNRFEEAITWCDKGLEVSFMTERRKTRHFTNCNFKIPQYLKQYVIWTTWRDKKRTPVV